MGHRVEARCLDCGETFGVDHGGGFVFHLVRCDKCGRTKSIGIDELDQFHPPPPKGPPQSHGTPGSQRDSDVEKRTSAKPISRREDRGAIEALAGSCRCGGKYRLDAPPRCPKCRSTRIEEGRITTLYD